MTFAKKGGAEGDIVTVKANTAVDKDNISNKNVETTITVTDGELVIVPAP